MLRLRGSGNEKGHMGPVLLHRAVSIEDNAPVPEGVERFRDGKIPDAFRDAVDPHSVFLSGARGCCRTGRLLDGRPVQVHFALCFQVVLEAVPEGILPAPPFRTQEAALVEQAADGHGPPLRPAEDGAVPHQGGRCLEGQLLETAFSAAGGEAAGEEGEDVLRRRGAVELPVRKEPRMARKQGGGEHPVDGAAEGLEGIPYPGGIP